MTTYWCQVAFVNGAPESRVRITSAEDGTISEIEIGLDPKAGDIRLATVIAGFGNAHSHAFHRALRGRTHGGGGDFWQWRTRMYRVAAALQPDLYRRFATAVFAEMVAAGYTSVGEFHYVHHHVGGEPYSDPENAMELALVDAARNSGIRLTLLDTCYLTGGIGRPLEAEQLRFGDGSVKGWLARWHRLAGAIGDQTGSTVRLGAAIHSVRAVPRDDIARLVDGLPDDTPLHIHLSEQPQENTDALERYGTTPTEVIAAAGALTSRLSAVHATHLTESDRSLLASAAAHIVMCPSTEADLGDGIGPARELQDAGARVCIGSDQNAVVDPLLELRGLEAGERLSSGRRGRFSPMELLTAGTVTGYDSLGWLGGIAVGSVCDLVELDPASVRTVGSEPDQLVLAATATDVQSVIVGGRVVAQDGAVPLGSVAELLAEALGALDLAAP